MTEIEQRIAEIEQRNEVWKQGAYTAFVVNAPSDITWLTQQLRDAMAEQDTKFNWFLRIVQSDLSRTEYPDDTTLLTGSMWNKMTDFDGIFSSVRNVEQENVNHLSAIENCVELALMCVRLAETIKRKGGESQ